MNGVTIAGNLKNADHELRYDVFYTCKAGGRKKSRKLRRDSPLI